MHWSLVLIDLNKRTMIYYDSLNWNGKKYMKTLAHLFTIYLNKYKSDDEGNRTLSTINAGGVIDLTSSEYSDDMNDPWDYKFAQDIPRQENTYDCGVFLCKYIEYLSRGEQITFTQQDMNYFRLLITTELLEGKLMI
jgi:Ulp1 family protease